LGKTFGESQHIVSIAADDAIALASNGGAALRRVRRGWCMEDTHDLFKKVFSMASCGSRPRMKAVRQSFPEEFS
jgi:hypothetical protein